MNRQALRLPSLALTLALGASAFLACAGSGDPASQGGDTTAPPSLVHAGDEAGAGTGPGLGVDPGTPVGPFTDFPAPIVDGTTPATAPTLFGKAAAGSAAGPCVTEPEADALYPRNWLRPRFKWAAGGGENLFEVRLHAGNQTQDLLVYTTASSWTMPRAVWEAFAKHSAGSDMTLTVRGGVFDGSTLGPVSASTQAMGVAPADAGGSIVYWTTTGGSALKGFSVGDESVVDVLSPGLVSAQQPGAGGTQCIGCHVSTPDGSSVAFSYSFSWGIAFAGLQRGASGTAASDGKAPSFLGAGATTAIAQGPRSISTFSAAHWSPGDRMMVTGATDEIVSIDLEAVDSVSAVKPLARTGDSQKACDPSWSHDGTRIAYVSTPLVTNARPGSESGTTAGATSDVYTVPYAARAGGAATAVAGASDPAAQEYYPAFSPDDHLLAFTSCPNEVNPYDQAKAEVFVTPAQGGARTRLAANDPPVCMNAPSPGITNSWARWAPVSSTAGGRTFYWLVFSSKRAGAGQAQLYLTSVVADGAGALTTHGAIHLWNQPDGESNHTPAWDSFQIPPAPPPIK